MNFLNLSFVSLAAPSQATKHSQPGYVLENKNMELFLTRQGGHIAPVTFAKDTGTPIEPFYISPWQDENLDIDVPVLQPLRGDFFCMPFGANAKDYQGEKHELHGEPATCDWTCEDVSKDGDIQTLTMTMDTRVRKGRVTKNISIIESQNNIYQKHTIEGMSGKMPVGHHANLAMPKNDRALEVSVGPFDFGMTNPGVVGDPAIGEYQYLDYGKMFDAIEKVPTLFKDPAFADCSLYPNRTGFTDLMCIFKKPSDTPGWTTAVNTESNYLWFAFKDAAKLPNTVFWISNRGRHSFPWNGRNRCLGLEETCSYFADGLHASLTEKIKQGNYPTSIELNSDGQVFISMIQGVVPVEKGFDKVKQVEFIEGGAKFISHSGKEATVNVNWKFVFTGNLAK